MKETRSSYLEFTLLQRLPNQALLVLVPQQNGKWLIERITAWDTSSPKEESLSFVGESPRIGKQHLEDLMVDPSGTYAIIRLKNFTADFSRPESLSAEIVLVDLRSFTIISQSTTNEPLLGGRSSWSFSPAGPLISDVQIKETTVPQTKMPIKLSVHVAITDTYQAAALSLPDLKPTVACTYERFLDDRVDGDHQGWRTSKVGEGCAELVGLAQVANVEALPGHSPLYSPYALLDSTYARLAGPTCIPADVSPSMDLELYECRTGHDFMDSFFMTTSSRDLRVLSVPEGKQALKVPLPHNLTPYPAVLANAGGQTWLLLLRDGNRIEAYRLP
ncbi:MAG TPA: hypothetical protein VMQ60_04975 [Acidobacteriaceae bacterium]|nr:hypothetical protein [Acidobacteriaceae bacterium]